MKTRVPLSGNTPTSSGPTPTEETLPDGQKKDHWVLPEEERAKGFVRPVRLSYLHVGMAGPEFPLRDLTEEEFARYSKYGYAKYESYPVNNESSVLGKFWTEKELARIGKACRGVTSMPRAIAETYARQPHYYGRTFCCHCGDYFPVGRDGEFVWDDESRQRVGT